MSQSNVPRMMPQAIRDYGTLQWCDDKITSPSFTVQQAIESCGFHKFQVVLCAISGLSWLAMAMEIMLLAVISPSLECEWALSSVEQALITTFVFFGWMVSSPFWGRGLMISSLVGFIFGILTSLSPTFYLFLAGRFGVGFAVGALAQSVTLTSEFLPSKNRARWLVVLKSFWAIGAAIEAAMAMVILPTLGWRWLVALSAVPLALFGVCSWWLPESAKFDVSRGRVVEARATLDRIARFNGRSLPEGELITETEEPSMGFLDLLKPDFRRVTIQVWTIWTLFGLLYIGLAVYTSLLLQSTRCDDATTIHNYANSTIAFAAEKRVKRSGDCRLLTTDNYADIILTTMSEVPGYILTAFAIDAIGRKATFAVGFGLFSVCSAVMAFCLPRFLIVTALFIGRSTIGAVWQAGYIYTGEVYPTSRRAQGLGVASSWGRVGAMSTPIITQMLASLNLIYPAVLYTAGGVLAVVLRVCPESVGRMCSGEPDVNK
ncbi:hypothetical protein PRIPAC_84013 [Pristionchus pacificus]|uniref:Membrane transporter n=1 Tax=Pristionchus pacificus TaxID=54126 RepID=A0A2A6BUW1_PRIPA|nr:hypothetical protein PRIPAC_84013 [Pristionchus pacificus]|eukprot:PDM69648.1 membrane transporter [Pristionchus pacificus]